MSLPARRSEWRLLEIVRTSSPGTRLPLRVIREGQVLELSLVVGDRAQWAAPSAYPARISYIEPPHRTAPIWPDGVEAKSPPRRPDSRRSVSVFKGCSTTLPAKTGGSTICA